MFLLSVGAHVAVLFFIPMPGQQIEEDVIAQPVPEEAETIQVARLPQPAEPEVDPSPAPPPVSDPQPTTQAQPQPSQAVAPSQATEPEPNVETEPDTPEADTGGADMDEGDAGNDDPETDDPDFYELARDIQNYQHNPNAGSTDVARDRLDDWKEYVNVSYSVTVPPLPFPVEQLNSVTYPLSECLEPEANLVTVGVVLDEQGVLKEDPLIIASSGYSVIDDLIKQKVKDYQAFPAENEVKAYQILISPQPEIVCTG